MKSIACLITLCALAYASGPSAATLYAFGDSLNDCCVSGPFTNDGVTNWLDSFAAAEGLTYGDPGRGSRNVAVGGAQSGFVNVVSFTDAALGRPTGFLSQVEQFVATNPTILPEDIAAIWVGTNDIWASALPAPQFTLPNGGPTIPANQPLGSQPSPQALAAHVAGNVGAGVARLAEVGFTRALILTPYDMAQSALRLPDGGQLNTAYSQALRDALGRTFTPGVDTIVVDIFALLEKVQADPAAFGFDPAKTDAFNACASNECIFLDFVHFTNGFNDLVAAEASAALAAGVTVPAPIPLPATAWLMLGGLAGLGLAGRWKAA